MKIPDYFALDTHFLKALLLDCEKENQLIKTEMNTYLNHSHYPELGEIRDYFIQKICWMKWGKSLEETKRVMRRVSILIAKNEKKINIEAWEMKVEHAKESVRIESVVNNYLNWDGNTRRRTKCPFHQSKGGTHLQIFPKTNSYHCFSCKASGGPINFVMNIENCDFKEAVDKLQYL